MSFLKRLSFYLGGFSVGTVMLLFFLSGKNTRCTYTPDARVIKDFSKKEWVLTPLQMAALTEVSFKRQ